jgi:hypothetical protein
MLKIPDAPELQVFHVGTRDPLDERHVNDPGEQSPKYPAQVKTGRAPIVWRIIPLWISTWTGT